MCISGKPPLGNTGVKFANLQAQVCNSRDYATPNPSTVAELHIQLGMQLPIRGKHREKDIDTVQTEPPPTPMIEKDKVQYFTGCMRAGLALSLRRGARVWMYQVFSTQPKKAPKKASRKAPKRVH